MNRDVVIVWDVGSPDDGMLGAMVACTCDMGHQVAAGLGPRITTPCDRCGNSGVVHRTYRSSKELNRLRDLESRLAECHPIAAQDASGDHYCVLCGYDETDGLVGRDPLDPTGHDPLCLWRLAKHGSTHLEGHRRG